MSEPETEVHTDAVRARAGATPGVMRYVLAISLALIVIVYLVIILT